MLGTVKDCSITHDELLAMCENNIMHVSVMNLFCNYLNELEHDGRRFFLTPKFYLVISA